MFLLSACSGYNDSIIGSDNMALALKRLICEAEVDFPPGSPWMKTHTLTYICHNVDLLLNTHRLLGYIHNTQ